MKFFLTVSLLTTLTSAASVFPSENKAAAAAAAAGVKAPISGPEAIVDSSSSFDLNDILKKLNPKGGSSDLFESFGKLMETQKFPKFEEINKLKEMFSSNKDIMNLLKSGDYKNFLNQDLIKNLYDGQSNSASDSTTELKQNVNEMMAKMMGIPVEEVEKNLASAMKDSPFFGKDFSALFNRDL